MKNSKGLLMTLAILNTLGAVVCLIVMLIALGNKNPFWPTYIPIVCSLLINAVFFAGVFDLVGRVDKIEDALIRNGISLEEPKKEPESAESQIVFRQGEPVRLKTDINFNGNEFSQNSSGMVMEVKDNNIYVVEFDDERGVNYEVEGTSLKSFFDK